MEVLRSYRRNAVHVRQALEFLHTADGTVGVERGYSKNTALMERYKRLSIPVRRALNPADKASFALALAVVTAAPSVDPAQLSVVTRTWQAFEQECDSTVGLGGHKVARRQILQDWLGAAAFYDTLDRDKPYDRLIDQWGTAIEGIGAPLTEQAAEVIVELDTLVASVLGEPVILPPPPKTPPPPPDPDDTWWKRLLRL
ncbi:MAG: hypothetical protein O2917_00475 [Acidobacteria bacterium]|nr:hypothetical protein [Acidobacteriota bacterium]